MGQLELLAIIFSTNLLGLTLLILLLISLEEILAGNSVVNGYFMGIAETDYALDNLPGYLVFCD